MKFENILTKNGEMRKFFDEDHRQLKINNHLPKIILPKNKLKMFRDWWNEDIRYESSVPHAFEEGYLIVDNDDIDVVNVERFSQLIKGVAKKYHVTYREVETQFKQFLEAMKQFTLHFKFKSENALHIDCYDSIGGMVSQISLEIGDGDKGLDLSISDDNIIDMMNNTEDVLNVYNFKNTVYLVTSLWYMATTATNTKYIYEEKRPVVVSRRKGVVQVSDTKYIRTPVYDFSKVKTVRVERLITRKKGWTYSHSFQVHGHYRHYKNGNTIFIESYIKGKGKPFKAQTTILDPSIIKEK